MKTLVFHGKVRTGIGAHAKLVFPGRNELLNAPSDWPKTLHPGSLNITINDDGYPSEFAKLQTQDKVKNLDSKIFPPAFTIPHAKIKNNTLKPCSEMSDKGTAQAWRANLKPEASDSSHFVWIIRRFGSGLGKQLEIVSEVHLRNALLLKDGTKVTVELHYEK